MSTPIRLTRRKVSKQLGEVEWRWPNGCLAVFRSLSRADLWASMPPSGPGVALHQDPEIAARARGATTLSEDSQGGDDAV